MNRPTREFDSDVTPVSNGARFAAPPIARWMFVLLALLTAGDGWAAKPAPTTKPAASLEAGALQLSATQLTLPALEAAATLTVRNASSSPAILVKPGLGFFTETSSNRWRDVSRSIYSVYRFIRYVSNVSSFPRRRESSVSRGFLDSRLRGNDGCLCSVY
jgi:hypothetical protein